jgi:thioredoxin 1
MSKPIELNNDNFESEVLKSDIPVVVDFWAPWCGPCLMVAPILHELAEEYDGRIKITKCNVDNNREIAGQYRIMSIPTMMMFKEGKLVNQQVGASGKDHLAKVFEQLL